MKLKSALLLTVLFCLSFYAEAEDPFWTVLREVPSEATFIVKDGNGPGRDIAGSVMIQWPCYKIVSGNSILIFDGRSSCTIDSLAKEVTLEDGPFEIPFESMVFEYSATSSGAHMLPIGLVWSDGNARETEVLLPTFSFQYGFPEEIFRFNVASYPSPEWVVTDLRTSAE